MKKWETSKTRHKQLLRTKRKTRQRYTEEISKMIIELSKTLERTKTKDIQGRNR